MPGLYLRAGRHTRWCAQLLAGVAAALLQRHLHPGESGLLLLLGVPAALHVADGLALTGYTAYFCASRLRRGASEAEVTAEVRRFLGGGK